MRSVILLGVALVLPLGFVPAFAGEKRVRPTEVPQGKTVQDVEKGGYVEGKQYQIKKKAKGYGGTAAQVTQLKGPKQVYMIGIQGYMSPLGLHVHRTMLLRDFDQNGRLVKPAEDLMVDARGAGAFTPWRLEPGDIITAIDGVVIQNFVDVVIAINTAANPSSIEIEFFDHETQRSYTGTFRAARVVP
jgi:S1-C subfamily serine protease